MLCQELKHLLNKKKIAPWIKNVEAEQAACARVRMVSEDTAKMSGSRLEKSRLGVATIEVAAEGIKGVTVIRKKATISVDIKKDSPDGQVNQGCNPDKAELGLVGAMLGRNHEIILVLFLRRQKIHRSGVYLILATSLPTTLQKVAQARSFQ